MQTNRNRAAVWLVAWVATLTCSCASSLTAKVVPGADLKAHKDFYVVNTQDNDPEMAPIIVGELQKMGFTAATGPEAQIPATADASVSFSDRWMWDMTMYLMQLDITITDPKTGVPLASGQSMRTSLVRESPAVMTREVFEEIFKTQPTAQ